MEKYYRFAGIELVVRIPPERMYRDDLQLSAFRVENVTQPHSYDVSLSRMLEPPVGEELACLPGARVYAVENGYVKYYGSVQDGPESAHTRAEHRGKCHTIQLKEALVSDTISARLVLNALDVEHLVASSGGVILHGSYIAWEGKAIVFTAPSGTGKSTQAELWKTHRGAGIVNGDRVVLMPENGRICAAGLPFSGSSRYCANQTLPLEAVVYLKQAPVTTIRQLRGLEAFRRVWEGCCVNTWNRVDMHAASGLVEKLLGQVPVYELPCTPDESAVKALEQQLRKQERE